MKVRTFFDLMDGYFQIRQTETDKILFDSHDDSYDKFEKYQNHTVICLGATTKIDVDNYDNVTVMPGVIVYIEVS